MSTALEQSDQPTVKTNCKNCIFAVFDGNIQTGCKQGRLEKYRKIGTNTPLVNGSYEIHGRICLYCRDRQWQEDNKVFEGENVLDKIESENAFKYDVFIVGGATLEGLRETVHSVIKQQIKPQRITVINKYDIQPLEIIRLFEGYDKQWTIAAFEETERNTIDKVVKVSQANFYLILFGGSIIGDGLSKVIHSDIVHELQQYPILLGKENGNGLFVQKKLHMLLNGNVKQNIEEKVKALKWKTQGIKEVYSNFLTLKNA